MKFQEIPIFEKTLRIDVDGYFHCPECKFEDKIAYEVSTHFEITHEVDE